MHDTITGTVDSAVVAGTVLVNQTVAYATTYDPAIGDNLAAVSSTTTASADLQVTKTADETDLRVGDTVTFTVTVTNAGPSVARDIEVTDTPAGLRATSATASGGDFDRRRVDAEHARGGGVGHPDGCLQVTDNEVSNRGGHHGRRRPRPRAGRQHRRRHHHRRRQRRTGRSRGPGPTPADPADPADPRGALPFTGSPVTALTGLALLLLALGAAAPWDSRRRTSR